MADPTDNIPEITETPPESYEGNVIKFPGAWRGRINPNVVLDLAERGVRKGDFRDVVFVTEDQDGMVNVTSSSHSNPDVLWLLEQAKLHILNVPEKDDEPEDLEA